MLPSVGGRPAPAGAVGTARKLHNRIRADGRARV
jgi:hypothetical protein